jgi:di/tricarboxylate transporter
MNNVDIALVIILIGALASGRIQASAAFGIFILAVAVARRLPFEKVLSQLVDPALITVIALVLFSRVLARIAWMRRLLFKTGRKTPGTVLPRFLFITALVSSVVPNTAVVSAFMGPASHHPHLGPRPLLMPLSFMALAAGMLTPIGTSTNLIVVGQSARAGVELSPLDFFFPGLAATLSVFVVLIVFSPRLLKQEGTKREHETETFHTEATVLPNSALVGRTVAENGLRNLGRFFLAELMRGDRMISPVDPGEVLQSGDVLVFVGDIRFMEEIASMPGLAAGPVGSFKRNQDNIVHAVVVANSDLAGSTLKEAGFRSRFDATVFAIRRQNERLSGKLGGIRLRAGDLLVLAAGRDFASRDDVLKQIHILETTHSGQADLSPASTVTALLAFGAFLYCVFAGSVPAALAAMLLIAFAIAVGLLDSRDMKKNFPFDLVMVLWGSLVLGALIAGSGIAAFISESFVAALPGAQPIVALILIVMTTWILTEFLSNVGAALISLPVALETARLLGVAPEAFALAVAFGASASFMLPFGYQTHMMVMAPGSYSFGDFIRLGAIALVVYAAASIAVIATRL